MDSDFNFLPSEIARLVLGYLKENDYTMTYKYFLKECPHLQEYSLMLKQGRHFPLTIMGVSLVTMVQEYADLKLKATQDGQWSQPLAPLWRQFEAVAKALKQATKIKAKQIVGDLQNSRTRRAMIKLKSRASSQSKQAMQSLTDFSDISRRSVPTPTKCNASDSNTIGPARNSYMLRSKNSTCGKEKVQVDSVCGLSSDASTLSTADLMRDDGANTNNQLGEGGDGNAFSNSGDERNPTETYSDDGVQTEVMQKDISEPGVVLSPSASSQSKNLEIRDSGVEYLLSGNVYHSSPMSQRKENESPRSLAAQATSSPVNTSQIDTNQELPNSSVNFFSTSATCFSDLTAISVVPATPEKSRSLQHEQLALPWSPTLKSPRRKRHPPKKRKDAINTPISTHVPANNSRCETHVEDIHPTGNSNTSLAVPELFEKILNDTKLHEKLAETINERFLEMKSSHSTTNTQTSARRKASELAILSSVSEDTMDKILNKPLTMSEENIIDGIIQLTTSDPVFDTLFKTFDAVDNGIAHIPGDVPNTDTYCGNATTSTSAEYIEPAVSTLQTSAPSPCCLSADSKTSTVSSELQDTMSKKKPRRIKPTPCGPPVTGNSVDSSPSPWSALRPVASPAFAQAPEQQVIGSVLGTQTSTVIHSSVNGPASAGDSPSMNSVAVTCQDVVMYSHTNTVMTQHFEQSQFSDRALLSQISPERSVNSADNLAGQICGASATCQAGCDGQQQSNEYTDVSITSDPSGQRSSGPFVQASPSVKTSASLALQAPMTSGPSVQRSPVSCVQVSAGPSSVQESASPCVQTSAVSGVGNVSPSVQNYYYSSDQLTGAGSGQNEIAMPASSYSGASGNSQFVSLASASQMNNNIVVSETVQTESGNVPNITTLYPSFSMEHSAVDGTSRYSPITSTTPTNGGIIVSGSTPQTNVPSETLLYETCGVDDGVCYQPVSTSSVVSYGPNTTLLSSPPTTAGSFLNQSVLPVVFSPSTNGVPSVSDSLQTVTCLPGSILSGSLGSESCDGENSETQIQKPAKKARPTARKTKSNPNPKRKCSKRSNKKGKRDMPVIVPATISSPLPQNINVSVQNNVTTAAADTENVSNMNVISVSTPQKTGDNTFDISQLITLSPGGQNWTLTENYNLTTEPMVVMTTTETPPKPNLTPLSNVQYVNSNLVSTQSPRGTQSVLLSSVIDVQTGSTYLKITSPARSPFKWPNILSKSGKKTSLHGQTSTEVNDGYFVNTKQPNVAPLSPHQETFIAVPICRKPDLVSKDHHVRSLSFDSMPITTISPSSLANPVTGAIMTYMSPKQKRSSNRSGTVCIRNLDCGGEAVTAADTPKPKVKGVKMVKTASSKIAPGQRIMELTLASPSGKKSTVMSLLDDGTPGGIRLPAKGKASPLKTVPEKKQLSVDSVPVKLPLPHLKRPPHKPHAIKPKPPATTVSKVKSRQKKKSSSSTKQTSTASHSASLKPSTSCSGRNLKRFTKLQGREKKSISNVSSDAMTNPFNTGHSASLSSQILGNKEEEAAWTLASFSSSNILAAAMMEADINVEDAISLSGMEDRYVEDNGKPQSVTTVGGPEESCPPGTQPLVVAPAVGMERGSLANNKSQCATLEDGMKRGSSANSKSQCATLEDGMKRGSSANSKSQCATLEVGMKRGSSANSKSQCATLEDGMKRGSSANSKSQCATLEDGMKRGSSANSKTQCATLEDGMKRGSLVNSKTQCAAPTVGIEKRHLVKNKLKAVSSVADVGGSHVTRATSARLRSLSPVVCLEKTAISSGSLAVKVKEKTPVIKTASSVCVSVNENSSVIAVKKSVCSTADCLKNLSVKPINKPSTSVGRVKPKISNAASSRSGSVKSALKDQVSETVLQNLKNQTAFEKKKTSATVSLKSTSPAESGNQNTLDMAVTESVNSVCTVEETISDLSSSKLGNTNDGLKEKTSLTIFPKPTSPVCRTSEKTETNIHTSTSSAPLEVKKTSNIDSPKCSEDSSKETNTDISKSGGQEKTPNADMLKPAGSEMKLKRRKRETEMPKSASPKCAVSEKTCDVHHPKSPHADGHTKERTSSATSTPRSSKKRHLVDYSTDEGSLDSNGSCGRKKRKLNLKTSSLDKLLSILHKS